MNDDNVYISIVQKSIYRKQTLDGVQVVQKSLRHRKPFEPFEPF